MHCKYIYNLQYRDGEKLDNLENARTWNIILEQYVVVVSTTMIFHFDPQNLHHSAWNNQKKTIERPILFGFLEISPGISAAQMLLGPMLAYVVCHLTPLCWKTFRTAKQQESRPKIQSSHVRPVAQRTSPGVPDIHPARCWCNGPYTPEAHGEEDCTLKEVRKTCIKMTRIRGGQDLCFMFVVWFHGYKPMEINTQTLRLQMNNNEDPFLPRRPLPSFCKWLKSNNITKYKQ